MSRTSQRKFAQSSLTLVFSISFWIADPSERQETASSKPETSEASAQERNKCG
ncbi:MAG: hypothetical protein V4674_02895 [Patescibacteria group bacterium]